MSLTKQHCTPCQGGIPPMPLKEAKKLAKALKHWKVSPDGVCLIHNRKFKDFKEAWAFVNKVGKISEKEGHHPDIFFGWGYVAISLHTHAIGGLHENDFILAAKIDEL